MTEPMKTAEEILRAKFSGLSHRIVTPVHPVQKTLIVAAMQEYADQEKSAERERIKHSIYLLYKNNDKPPVLGAIHEIIDSFMTEPIDQTTKDLIEKEADRLASSYIYSLQSMAKNCYTKGATVWAEKLRQLETQSHDQVRIIEHLEGQLKQERTLIKDLVGYVIAYKGLASLTSDEDIFIQSLLKKAKDKSHE